MSRFSTSPDPALAAVDHARQAFEAWTNSSGKNKRINAEWRAAYDALIDGVVPTTIEGVAAVVGFMAEAQERLAVKAAGDADEFEPGSFFASDGDAYAFLQHMADVLARIVARQTEREADLPLLFNGLLGIAAGQRRPATGAPELQPVG